MNFYFSFFVIIFCLGTCVSPSRIYFCLGKSRLEGRAQETTRTLNGGTGFPIINGLVQAASQVRSWTQWIRRLLKALRKWCSSHPPEVKLGKCFASYFNIKIPWLRRYEKIARFIENKTETKFPREMSKKFKTGPEATGERPSRMRIFKATSQRKYFTFLVSDFLSESTSHFRQYRDFIFKNDLVACLWDYFWKKFWIWVDSAPDSDDRV